MRGSSLSGASLIAVQTHILAATPKNPKGIRSVHHCRPRRKRIKLKRHQKKKKGAGVGETVTMDEVERRADRSIRGHMKVRHRSPRTARRRTDLRRASLRPRALQGRAEREEPSDFKGAVRSLMPADGRVNEKAVSSKSASRRSSAAKK